MATTVIVREDYALVVACEFCHLSPGEAVAVLRYRLDKHQGAQACRTCAHRMGVEVSAQLAARARS